MFKTLLCLLLSLLISSCSTCFKREIYKPKFTSQNKPKVSVEEFNFTFGAIFEFGDFATLRVSECTLKPKGFQAEPEEICLTAQLDEMHTMKVPYAILEVYSDRTTNHEIPMGDWEYRQESDSTPATNSTIKQKTRGADFYTFEATALFNGATSKWHPPVARALWKDMRRREYTSSIKLPSKLGNKFYVKLPVVYIDGKEHILPILEFNKVEERFCRPHV